jgi:hypothetical protein
VRYFAFSLLLLGAELIISLFRHSEGIWDNYRVKRHMIHSSCVYFSHILASFLAILELG